MDDDLGGSFALGPWRVRRVGYGAMQLAGDGVFGPPRDRDEALRVLRAAVQQYQAAQVAYASAPVIKKYLGTLAAVDVYTASTAFVLLESIRLDLGEGSQVHA